MFEELFTLDKLFDAWKKFKKGKSKKADVIEFEFNIENNIFSLHQDIINSTYRHNTYTFFKIFDNKKRDIFKACVRDRLVHQIIYDYLVKLYEQEFISDSYSSRIGKGNLRAIKTLKYFIKLCTKINEKSCWILKCDIKKYFQSINHSILLNELKHKIKCPKIIAIIEDIIKSFHTNECCDTGIPLGNITSQIFANIYLHSLDIYIKKDLYQRFYIRYNDDFVIVGSNHKELSIIRDSIIRFVKDNLMLEIPIEKTSTGKSVWGLDFLGYTVLPESILLRNRTKSSIYTRMNEQNFNSYMALLKHCNSHRLKQKIIANHMTYHHYFEI